MVGEVLAAFSGHEGGKMVDGDDLQGKRLVEDGEGGFLEGGQGVVDRQRVVGIVRVAADIGDDGEFSLVLTLLYQGQ